MKIGILYYTYPIYQGGSHIQEFLNNIAIKVENVSLLSIWSPKVRIKNPKKLRIRFLPSFDNSVLNNLSFGLLSFFYMLFSKDFREVDIIHVISARGILPAYFFSKIFPSLFAMHIIITAKK